MPYLLGSIYHINTFQLLEPNDAYATVQIDSVWQPDYPVNITEKFVRTFFGYDDENKYEKVYSRYKQKVITYNFPYIKFGEIEDFIATVSMYNGSFNIKLFDDGATGEFGYMFAVFSKLEANSMDAGYYNVSVDFISYAEIQKVEQAPPGWGGTWSTQWGDF